MKFTTEADMNVLWRLGTLAHTVWRFLGSSLEVSGSWVVVWRSLGCSMEAPGF